jgi:hypothetical protein
MHTTRIAAIILATALAGCAANVQKQAAPAPLAVDARASRNVVVNLSGSKAATGARDWEPMKGE